MRNVAQRGPSDQAGLLRAFKISVDDLEANRAGRLSRRQTGRLCGRAAANGLGAVAIAGAVIAVLVLVAAKPLVWYQFLLCGLIAAGGFRAGVGLTRHLLRAIGAGVVESAEGPVILRLHGRNGWFLVVDGRSFRLPVHFWHVAAGRRYRVYVAPAANRIVAMERL